MFLIRTERTTRGTASAVAALAYVRRLQALGQNVTVTNISGRPLSAADLRRHITATDAPLRH